MILYLNIKFTVYILEKRFPDNKVNHQVINHYFTNS